MNYEYTAIEVLWLRYLINIVYFPQLFIFFYSVEQIFFPIPSPKNEIKEKDIVR